MNNYKKINTKGQKSQQALPDNKQRAKMLAYLKGGAPRVHSEANEENSVQEDLSSGNVDSYRFRVKLLEKIKRPPRSEAMTAKRAKPRSVPDENDGTKAEKLEVLNNLLTKKNSLLEQNLAKLKQENKLLKKAAYLVMESKDLPSNEWKEQFEESVANITLDSDIFPDIRQQHAKAKPHRQSARKQSINAENSITESVNQELRERIFELEDQNKKLSRKVRELEDILANRSIAEPKSSSNYNHKNHNRSSKSKSSAYDQDEGRNEGDEDLKTILDEAITKIKTMEYELESFERKNEHLQTELRNQKKMTEFNEKSYVKLQDNQKKLMEENMKLQKGYQNVMKDLEKIRNSGGYTRGSQHL